VRTERGLDRLVTFADAVVAIAITLLVLPLVDVLDGESAAEGLGTVMREEVGQFGAFLLSFVVIAHLWLVHHRLVEQVGAYDGALVLVTMAWVLTVVLLPFATQVVGTYGTERPAVALYTGTILASSACLTALSILLWRRPGLRRAGHPQGFPWPGVVTTAALAVALLLGTLVPAVNYWALLLLVLTGWVERRWRPPG
jgi:uncharacterized membrane protein